jgi:Lrp/AsnC family transcriptional regulator for asnA, asnC and gidA
MINVSGRSVFSVAAEVAELSEAIGVTICTGRYDIMVEVLLPEGTDDLYTFINDELSAIGGVAASESFMVMKAKRKWVPLPRAVRRRFFGQD